MAQKTIYVKDENVNLYEKAEQLSGKKFSDLVADLVKDYILNREDEGDYYAVCSLDETVDNIPTFIPEYFIKATTGMDIFTVRKHLYLLNMEGKRKADILYPLLNNGGEFEDELKMQLLEGKLDIVELP
jgi:hypothetical protein